MARLVTSSVRSESLTVRSARVQPPGSRTMSPGLAYAAGAVLETIYRLLRLRGEPRMTRFVARELSTAHWFDLGAARRDFGYAPQVSFDEGIERLRVWLRER